MKLSDILGHVSETDFFEQYWERKPLVVKGGRNGYCNKILTLNDLSYVLSNQRLRKDECKVSKEGKILPPSLYQCDYSMRVMEREVNDIVDTNKLLSLYTQGATLVFSEFNSRWYPVQQLKQEIEQAFKATVLTNVFLTNARAQGFSVHYDSHDVILLQLSGTKHWTIYSSPIELPLKSQAFGRYLSQEEATKTVSKLFEIDLEAGDVMYLPRGYMHEAKTLDQPSLHLTLGIHPKLAADYLVDAMTMAGHYSPDLRRALTTEFYHGSTDDKRAKLTQWLNLAMESLPDEVLEKICSEYSKRVTGLTAFCTPDQLLRIHAARIPDDKTRLVSDQIADVQLDEYAGLLSIHRGEKKLAVFPSSYRPSVEYILNHKDYSLQDIPGDIGIEAKIHLLEKFQTNGIVAVA
jgi:ribosomal protein L16 Arg81 hydroxylase